MAGLEAQWGRRENFLRRVQRGRLPAAVFRPIQLQLSSRRSKIHEHTRTTVCLGLSRPRGSARLRRLDRVAQSATQIDRALKAAYDKYKDLQEGKNADYIPALAKVDPKIYGIALVTSDGKVYTAGDVKSEVSIQSISKVFTMAKVIEEQGPDAIVQAHRRRRDRHALQLDRRGRVRAEGARRTGDQSARQPRRDHHDQHGQGRDPRRGVEEASSAIHSDFAGRPLDGQPGSLQVRGRRPTSATRPSAR